MNNEDKILEILLQMQGDISSLKAGQAKLESEVSDLKTEMHERFDSLELSVKEAWKDIGIVEDRVGRQEDIIQKKIM